MKLCFVVEYDGDLKLGIINIILGEENAEMLINSQSCEVPKILNWIRKLKLLWSLYNLTIHNSQRNAKNGLNSHKINLFSRTNYDQDLELKT